MRTTLDIDDKLLIEAKVVAAKQRTTLTRLVEEGLKWRTRRSQVPVNLPLSKQSGGLHPGIDPTSNKSLFRGKP